MTIRPPAGVRGRSPRTRRPFTGRALILGAVMVLLVVILAAPLHRYLAARSALQQSITQRDSGQKQLQQLQQLDEQLSNPAYIEQQARIRLQYAMPGDTVYQVVQPGSKPSLDNKPAKSTTVSTVNGATWNQRLWGSVESADRSP
jgi:cell division protein FtsB